MLATEALRRLENVEIVEDIAQIDKEHIIEEQIKHIKRLILFYSIEGKMKIYKRMYILPEVLEYFQKQGYTLCDKRISWKNATFGNAFDTYMHTNSLFTKRIKNIIKKEWDSDYCISEIKFPRYYKYCRETIKLLEELGYIVIQTEDFLIISVRNLKPYSSGIGEMNLLPTAQIYKDNCIKKQIQLIDSIIEKAVQNCLFVADINSIGYVFPEVEEYYVSLGYNADKYISWKEAKCGKALENLDFVNMKIISICVNILSKKRTSLFLDCLVTDTVIDRLKNDGYDITIYSDGVVISWKNATDMNIGSVNDYRKLSCVDKEPLLVYLSVGVMSGVKF